MESKKQTAVEWLIEKLDYFHQTNGFIEIVEKAKAMEKEQIMDAITYGCSDWGSVKNAEAYYNKNFNK